MGQTLAALLLAELPDPGVLGNSAAAVAYAGLNPRIVVMDNLANHKGPKVRDLIGAADAELQYPPPHSPDFNPIENAFTKLNALQRRVAPRTVDALWSAISRLVDLVTPAKCVNMFAAAGYDTP